MGHYLLECSPRKSGHLENTHVCEAEADQEEDGQTETRKESIGTDKKKEKAKMRVARGNDLQDVALGAVYLREERLDPARETG